MVVVTQLHRFEQPANEIYPAHIYKNLKKCYNFLIPKRGIIQ